MFAATGFTEARDSGSSLVSTVEPGTACGGGGTEDDERICVSGRSQLKSQTRQDTSAEMEIHVCGRKADTGGTGVKRSQQDVVPGAWALCQAPGGP